MTHLTKQKEQLEALLSSVNPLNDKGKAREFGKLLDSFIPNVEKKGGHPDEKIPLRAFGGPAECKTAPGRKQDSDRSAEGESERKHAEKLRDLKL